MKIKGLLFGLFACAALAACTNDDIVENNGKGEQEKVKANLTLVLVLLLIHHVRQIMKQVIQQIPVQVLNPV